MIRKQWVWVIVGGILLIAYLSGSANSPVMKRWGWALPRLGSFDFSEHPDEYSP